MQIVRSLSLVLAITALASIGLARSSEEQRIGAETHPKIVAQFGGVYEDEALARYVDGIGRRLARLSRQPNDPWTFTVLDSPVVNAFALPGGYVYVTRGLLALANDEAELAGVLGHEIGHVTAEHFRERSERGNKAGLGLIVGTILGGVVGGKDGARDVLKHGGRIAQGYLAGHSREHEFEADTIGVSLLVRAGYDPYAQADFLDSLSAQYALNASLDGQTYNPNRVDFFASHPATAKRVREAIDKARASGVPVASAPRGEAKFLRAIDGMIYGDSPEEGFVRGQRFSHAELRFTYRVPDTFTITNSTTQVIAKGPGNALMILDGAPNPSGSLQRYLMDVWVRRISEKYQTGRVSGLETLNINGLEAATVTLPVSARGKASVAQLTVIRLNGRLYRLQGISAEGDRQTRRALRRAVETFRGLSAAEAARLQPYRLTTYRVQSGDTVNALSATIPMTRLREERFRTLNSYRETEPQAGDLIKLIVQ